MDQFQLSCFVPGCDSTIGVVFPQNPALQKMWLKSLHLEHMEPQPNSFVCLDHIGPDGIPYIQKSGDIAGHTGAVCRLCMSQLSDTNAVSVVKRLNENYSIAEAINMCLKPIKISPRDRLSKLVCIWCTETLKRFLNFYELCVLMDRRQQDLLSDVSDTESDISDSYICLERLSDYLPANDDEIRTAENLIDSTEELLEILEENHNSFEKSDVNTMSKSGTTFRNGNSQRNAEEVISKVNKTQADEALLKVLGDNDSYDRTGVVEDIIIEMVNGEVPVTLNQLSVKVKEVDSETKKRQVEESDDMKNTKRRVVQTTQSEEVIVFPRGIRVELFKSPLGTFKSTPVFYVFNSEYLKADNYIYEYRLVKNNSRGLVCLLSSCPGAALQSQLGANTFLDEIEVIESHNHEAPDESERKKQLFYNILRDKKRNDKQFNSRTFYQQFCEADPSIVDIVSLRQMIKSMNEEGSKSSRSMTISSFEEFYQKIEHKDLYSIQFNENHTQFYQERFKTSDGGKAILFGSRDMANSYSASKLMYVDGSFIINTSDYPFQLVTVLLMLDDTFYPVFYIFVNKRSRQLYKAIFGFVHTTFHDVRPNQIVTDLEANLFYALCEVYEKATVEGSLLHFVQSVYKKLCTQNLAKEQETNATFRQVYNRVLMLPLLPSSTIGDAFEHIRKQSEELQLTDDKLTALFDYVQTEWIEKVTPHWFSVYRKEHRINENIVGPFKKLRDLIATCRTKNSSRTTLMVVRKLMEFEKLVRESDGTCLKDTNHNQHKKMALKAWNDIEHHPEIDVDKFYIKVASFVKTVENLLWIWGFYRQPNKTPECLIDASNFSSSGHLKKEIS